MTTTEEHLRQLPIIHLHVGNVVIDEAGEHEITAMYLNPPFTAAYVTANGETVMRPWDDKTNFTVRI